MKKLLVLAASLAITTAQGAAFVWGTGSVKSSFDGTAFTSTSYSVTGYLVYLASGDVSSMFTVSYDGEGSITGASSVDTKTPTTSGSKAARGRITGTYDSTDIANGNKYGMYIMYTDDSGVAWYNFSSTVYTVEGLVDDTSMLENAVYSFNFDTKTTITSSSQSVSAGGGWYSISVPEPSTAFLGLLGIGMLIRRRRA